MSDLTCTHCYGTVPLGAKVCRGCQAEVEYGAPPFTFLLVAIASVIAGVTTSNALPAAFSFLGWVVGIGCFVGGCVLLVKLFENRVSFNRKYRTK